MSDPEQRFLRRFRARPVRQPVCFLPFWLLQQRYPLRQQQQNRRMPVLQQTVPFVRHPERRRVEQEQKLRSLQQSIVIIPFSLVFMFIVYVVFVLIFNNVMRIVRDSNPRYLSVYTLSKRSP